MIHRILLISAWTAVGALSQSQGGLQERIAALRESVARNQAELKQYTWTETTEISLKGEVKKREQKICAYGPDGKVQKTPVAAAPPPSEPKGRKRGLKARIVANKIDEMKDYMERVASLLGRYVPPDPQAMQQAFQSGKATLNPGLGAIVFSDYVKPGDKVTFTFNQATKKLSSFAVSTYLDKPDDAVTVNARFASLPDGTNFLAESVLNATGEKIQVKTSNSGHRKAGG